MPTTAQRFEIRLLHPRFWMTWLGLLFFFLLTRLPIRLLDRIAARLGRILMRRNRKRYAVVEKNISLCFPDLTAEQLAAQVQEHFEMVAISLMHYGLFWWSGEKRLEAMIQREGFEQVEASRDAGRNTIVLLSHCTGLEFAVFAVSRSWLSAGPYKPLPNPVIDWLVQRVRERVPDSVLFTRDDGLRPLIRFAREGKVIVYLADEDLGAEASEFAAFFGVQKATIPLLGRLAKACQADVFPAIACYDRESCRYRIKLFAPSEDFPSGEKAVDTLAMNRMIEKTVLACPAQYFWTMKFFKTRPAGEDGFYQ